MLHFTPAKTHRGELPMLVVGQPTRHHTPGTPAATRFPNRNWFLLWQGQTVSRLGNQAFDVALLFWIKDAIGSATFMGLALAFARLPGLLLEPIGGALADRVPRKRIIVVCDLLAGIAVLSLAFVMLYAPVGTGFKLGWLIGVATFLAVISAFFGPAISATVPDLVPPAALAKANAMGQLSMQVSLFIGQGLGGVLYRLLGAPLLFLLDGLSFVFSSASETLIDLPERKHAAEKWTSGWTRFRDDIMVGLRYVWHERGLRAFLILSTGVQFFGIPVSLLLPFYVEDVLGVRADWYGYIAAAFGVGALLGYMLLAAVEVGGRGRARITMAAYVLGGIGNVLLGMNRSPLLAVGLALLGGFTSGMVGVVVTTALQLTTPAELRGRVFGVLGTLAGSIAPIALGLSGIVADLLDQNIPLIYTGCGVAVLILCSGFLVSPALRSFVAYEPPAREAA